MIEGKLCIIRIGLGLEPQKVKERYNKPFEKPESEILLYAEHVMQAAFWPDFVQYWFYWTFLCQLTLAFSMCKKQSSKTELKLFHWEHLQKEWNWPLLERSNQVLHSQNFGQEYIRFICHPDEKAYASYSLPECILFAVTWAYLAVISIIIYKVWSLSVEL